jgi:hypothetical protein
MATEQNEMTIVRDVIASCEDLLERMTEWRRRQGSTTIKTEVNRGAIRRMEGILAELKEVKTALEKRGP